MTIDTLMDAVVTSLNGESFDETFTAAINYDPRVERSEMGSGWHVWVVPVDLPSQRKNRGQARRESVVDVGFIKRVTDLTPATISPYLAFVDAVQKFVLESMKFLDGHDLTEANFDTLYSPEHLRQQSVFFSVLSLTYLRHPG